jgi:hypothetical protein
MSVNPPPNEQREFQEWIERRLEDIRKEALAAAKAARYEAITVVMALSIVGAGLGWLGLSYYLGLRVKSQFDEEIRSAAKPLLESLKADADRTRSIVNSVEPLRRSTVVVGCAVPQCVAVDQQGTIYHYNTNSAGVEHKSKVIGLKPPFSVSCSREGRCIIVDTDGSVNVGNASDVQAWKAFGPIR